MNLSAEEVSVRLSNRDIVREVSLHVAERRFVGLLGPNGSGKTTLLKSVYRVLKPSAGLITLDDVDIRKLSYRETARRMGVISQFNVMNFDFNVEEVVLMGRAPHKAAFSRDTEEDYRVAEEALKRVDMLDFRDRSYNTLSGGEKQRVLLARTLAQQVELLILHDLQLLLVLQRIQRRVPQQRNDRNEKLRPHHIHLFIPVGHIHDSVIVKFIINLKQ